MAVTPAYGTPTIEVLANEIEVEPEENGTYLIDITLADELGSLPIAITSTVGTDSVEYGITVTITPI